MSSNIAIISIVIPTFTVIGFLIGRHFAIIRKKKLESFPSARHIPDAIDELREDKKFRVVSPSKQAVKQQFDKDLTTDI